MSIQFLFANNAATTLAANITSGATSCTLATGTGSEFPNPGAGQQFALTFTDAATGLIDEIVYVTARTGDVLTIVRGQEGTTPVAWSAGDNADSLVTAGNLASFIQPSTGRIKLTANTTFNISPSGNDATGDGSIGSPWLTLQHAFDTFTKSYDFGGFQATINCADSLLYAGGSVNGLIPGQNSPIIVNGNAGTPTNVQFNSSIGSAGSLQVQNFKVVTTSGVTACLLSSGNLVVGSGIVFGTTTLAHLYANNGTINIANNYTISAGAPEHYLCTGGKINVGQGVTVTLTGTPAFANSFASCDVASLLTFGSGVIFSGGATGQRYFIDNLSLIAGTGGVGTFLPGNSAGVNNGHGAIYN